MGKSKFYNRVRSAIKGITEKSSERVILDLKMVSPLVNDKGHVLVNNKSVKKRSLKKQNRGTRYQ